MELLKVGLTISGIGMGFVLSFLCILIFAMFVMSNVLKFIGKFCPEQVPETVKSKRNSSDDDGIIAAVIAAARRAK